MQMQQVMLSIKTEEVGGRRVRVRPGNPWRTSRRWRSGKGKTGSQRKTFSEKKRTKCGK